MQLEQYIAAHPDINRLDLVIVVPLPSSKFVLIPPKLTEIAAGLDYLHYFVEVHGDFSEVWSLQFLSRNYADTRTVKRIRQ